MTDIPHSILEQEWLNLFCELTEETSLSHLSPKEIVENELKNLKITDEQTDLFKHLYQLLLISEQEKKNYSEIIELFQKIIQQREKWLSNSAALRLCDQFLLDFLCHCPDLFPFLILKKQDTNKFTAALTLQPSEEREILQLSAADLVIVDYIIHAKGIVQLYFALFPIHVLPAFLNLAGTQDWQEVAFVETKMPNEYIQSLLGKFCANPAVTIVTFGISKDSLRQLRPHFLQFSINKPELTKLVLMDNEGQVSEIPSEFVVKRAYLLHSSCNPKLITKPTPQQREHLINFTRFFFTLEEMARNLEKSTDTTCIVAPLSAMEEYNKTLKKPLREIKEKLFEEPDLVILYTQLIQFADVLLPECPANLLKDYWRLLAYYFKTLKCLDEQHQVMAENSGNPYPDLRAILPFAQEIDAAFNPKLLGLMEKLHENILAIQKKLNDTRKKAPYHLDLLIAASASLCLRITRALKEDIKHYYREIAFFFEHNVIQFLQRKEHIWDSFYNNIIFSGLLLYVTTDLFTQKKPIKLVENSFQLLVDLVTHTSNRLFRLFATNTLNLLFEKTYLLEFKVADSIKKTDQLGKLHMPLPVDFPTPDPSNTIDPFMKNFFLALHLFQINKEYVQFSTEHQKRVDQYSLIPEHKGEPLAERVDGAAVEFMKKPANERQLFAKIDKFTPLFALLRKSFLLQMPTIWSLDQTQAIFFDPAVTFNSYTAVNGHLLQIYEIMIFNFLFYIDARLESLNSDEILQENKANSEEFHSLYKLLQYKIKLIEERQKRYQLLDTIAALFSDGILTLPVQTTKNIIDQQKDKDFFIDKLNNDLQYYRGLFDQAQLIIQKQQTKAQQRVAEFEKRQHEINRILQKQCAGAPASKITKKKKRKKNQATRQNGNDQANQHEQQQQKSSPSNEKHDYYADIVTALRQDDFDKAIAIAKAAITEAKSDRLEEAALTAQLGNVYQTWITTLEVDHWQTIPNLHTQAQFFYDQALALCAGENEGEALSSSIRMACQELGFIISDHHNDLLAKAHVCYQHYQHAEALNIYETLFQNEMHQEAVILGLIKCHQRRGEFKQALQYAERFHDQFDLVKLRMAVLLHKMDRIAEAEACYSQLKRSAKIDISRSYAEFLFQTGKFNELRFFLDKIANDRRRNFAPHLFVLAWFLYRLKHYEQSENYFRQLLRLQPENIFYKVHYVNLLFTLNKHDEAKHILDKIIEQHPYYVPAQLALVDFYVLKHELIGALHLCEKLLQKHPDYWNIHTKKLNILRLLHRQKQVNSFVARMKEKFPEHPDCRRLYRLYHSQPDGKLLLADSAKEKSRHPLAAETKLTVKPLSVTQPMAMPELKKVEKIKIPVSLVELCELLEQIGKTFFYGPCAYRLIQQLDSQKITLVLFTNREQFLPTSTEKLLQLNRSPIDNLYTGELEQWKIVVYVNPAKMTRKDFVSGLDTTANSFLIDKFGTLYDELGVFENVFTGKVSKINSTAIQNSPVTMMHAIYHHYEYATQYDPEDLRLIQRHAHTLTSVMPGTIMPEFRKAVCSSHLKTICEDWLKCGILTALLPQLDTLLKQEDLQAKKAILSFAQDCDQMPDRYAPQLLTHFFAQLLWLIIKNDKYQVEQSNFSDFIQIHPFLTGLYEKEEKLLIEKLEEKAMNMRQNTFFAAKPAAKKTPALTYNCVAP